MAAPALVGALHGQCLRILSDHFGMHFNGLGVAARVAAKQGLIPPSMRKKLEHVDFTFAIERHIAEASVRDLVSLLQTLLAANQQGNERVGLRSPPSGLVQEDNVEMPVSSELPRPEVARGVSFGSTLGRAYAVAGDMVPTRRRRRSSPPSRRAPSSQA